MSISRNPKNKRWYVLVDVPAGPDGKRRRRGVGGFKTKREAKAAEAEALRRIRDGVYVEPSRLTVGAYLTEMWLPSMASQVRATTLGGYRHNVRAYLVPKLGDIPIQRLTTARVGAFYSELMASGGRGGRPLSPKTVRYVHTTLRRALRDAVADGLVVRNVAAQARPPRARRVEMHTWTAEQVGTFLASVREDRLYPAWLLLATLGMRRGELLGLRWVDVDLTSGRIAIRHTLVMVDGKPAMAEPKTAKGPPFPHSGSGGAGHVACSPRPSGGRAAVLGCRLHRLGLGHHDRGRPAIPPGDALGPVRPPGQASRAPADPTP
jgi:integrase